MNPDAFKEAATRKLGPLPAWAWGVVAAAGIWVYRSISNSKQTPTYSPNPSTNDVGGSLTGGAWGGYDPYAGLPITDPGFGAPYDPYIPSPVPTPEPITQPITQPAPVAPSQPVAPAPTSPTAYLLRWASDPLCSGTLGTYPTRLAAAQQAIQVDPNSNPPGSGTVIDYRKADGSCY